MKKANLIGQQTKTIYSQIEGCEVDYIKINDDDTVKSKWNNKINRD